MRSQAAQIEMDQDTNNSLCERWFWTCQDANYNVVSVTNVNGLPMERYEYSPYGTRTVYSHRWLMADADDDGIVNIVELGLIGTYWQHTETAGTRFDYNGDEYIDIIDLGIVGTWWQA